jgi:hypothetical protein
VDEQISFSQPTQPSGQKMLHGQRKEQLLKVLKQSSWHAASEQEDKQTVNSSLQEASH